MKVLRFIGKTVFFLLLVVLFLFPVVALYYVSKEEQTQYATPSVSIGPERGYGKPCAVFRADMAETTVIHANVVSNECFFIELSNYRYPYQIRWLVSQGDAVDKGDILGVYNDSEILSETTGVIQEINLGDKPYIRLGSLNTLVLESYISDKQETIFNRRNLNLTDENGKQLSVLDIDLIRTEQGRKILLQYDSTDLVYGTAYDDFKLYTGKLYPQALVVDASCVYQKPMDDAYYVRLLDENGYFLREATIEVGYSDGDLICISGVEEGSLCDSGYKSLIEVHDNAGT